MPTDSGLQMRYAPLNVEDLDMLQIEMQQTPTDDLINEANQLRNKIRGGLVGEREPGSGTHPILATLQLVERELKRRGGDWADPEITRVIGRADVPLDGPQILDMTKRFPPPGVTDIYASLAKMTTEATAQFEEIVGGLATNELRDLRKTLEEKVETLTGLARSVGGLHPDLEKLELVEIELLERAEKSSLIRGALVGAGVGGVTGMLTEASVVKTSALFTLISLGLTHYSARYRKLIGAEPEPG